MQADSENSDSESDSEEQPERGDVSEWCLCGNCTNMDSHREKVCCHDVDVCLEKFVDAIIHYNLPAAFNCITEHQGFSSELFAMGITR